VAGPAARPDAVGPAGIAVVDEAASITAEPPAGPDGEDVTREVSFDELVQAIQDETAIEAAEALVGGPLSAGGSGPELVGTEPTLAPVAPEPRSPVPVEDSPSGSEPLVSANTAVSQIIRRAAASSAELIDLDGRDGAEYRPLRGSPGRVLVVDDDFASRHLLVKELIPLGYEVQTAEHGGEALARITGDPPDVIVVDLLLPEIDGFHICRAVKQSRKYSRIAVVLISAMIDSGRVTDEVLRRYGADAYFEKPLHMDRLKLRLQELMVARGAGEPGHGQVCFERAMAHYRAGHIDAAVSELRRGIEEDPLSAKHHFVLANILHKKALIVEAIDEYEATLEIKPDYFPALTRLAYLYYKQGYSVRAIDTWRRSLPLCSDPGLRHNIELFMRKLIAELGDR
jgi:CheY-like chemotaxis protein